MLFYEEWEQLKLLKDEDAIFEKIKLIYKEYVSKEADKEVSEADHTAGRYHGCCVYSATDALNSHQRDRSSKTLS